MRRDRELLQGQRLSDLLQGVAKLTKETIGRDLQTGQAYLSHLTRTSELVEYRQANRFG